MNQAFLDYYRCPEGFVDFTVAGELSGDRGYFRIGRDAIGYGATASGVRSSKVGTALYDALPDVVIDGARPRLPFDPAEAIENLRRERYLGNSAETARTRPLGRALQKAYYFLRPAMPIAVRKHLQRAALRVRDEPQFPSWPIDRSVEGIVEQLFALLLKAHAVDRIPFIWFWPEGAPSCTILTHDVEALSGRDFCSRLMDLDDSVGIKSSFQIVPEERYAIPEGFLSDIRERGFEINVHDLNHDGRLFADRRVFLQRAPRINRYGRAFAALGFRSGSLYRNLDWFEALDFSYDMSVPNAAHLEAQPGGCCTVMPFFIGKTLELPVTATQDYSLFHILRDYSIRLWKQEIALITERHGLTNLIVHPDYIVDARAQDVYRALLDYLAQLRSDKTTWIALPRDVDQWWRQRSRMTWKREGRGWRIEGAGQGRARIAYASLDHGRLVYSLEQDRPGSVRA